MLALSLSLLLATNTATAASLESLQPSTKLKSMLIDLKQDGPVSRLESLEDLNGSMTRQGFEALLKYLDPQRVLSSYARWDDDRLIVFTDRNTHREIDFSLAFKHVGKPRDPQGLIHTLKQAALVNSKVKPLSGLRIALDPGHVGGKWDLEERKYVRQVTPEGETVLSEGLLALQVGLLLSNELKKLGAEVLLTRTTAKPVAANALNKSELSTRARHINAFQPHLTIVIHFDAAHHNALQSEINEVRGYIPGNLLPEELSTRAARHRATRHLFDGHRWVESGVLTASLVNAISQQTGVPPRGASNDFNAVKVATGVYARNLILPRLLNTGATAYIETLRYDHETEFQRLIRFDRKKEINGITLHYSSRLDDIVRGYKQGILDYVKSYSSSRS